MESGKLIQTVLVLGFIFGTGVTIAVSVAWFEYRTRTRALDVLRVYAERGEEAPASVVQALVHVSGRPPYRPPKVPTRANHLAHAAADDRADCAKGVDEAAARSEAVGAGPPPGVRRRAAAGSRIPAPISPRTGAIITHGAQCAPYDILARFGSETSSGIPHPL